MMILCIEMINLIFEPILFAEEYSRIVNRKNNSGTNIETNVCMLINCNLMCSFGGICSLFVIDQAICYWYDSKIFGMN